MAFFEEPFCSLSLEPYLEALNDSFVESYLSKDKEGDIHALLIREDERFVYAVTSGSRILLWTGREYFGEGSEPSFTKKGKYTKEICLRVGLDWHENDTVEETLHEVRSWILNKIKKKLNEKAYYPRRQTHRIRPAKIEGANQDLLLPIVHRSHGTHPRE